MERGGTKTFKGKSLDEIDVNLEENLLNHVEENDESDAEATQLTRILYQVNLQNTADTL
jgi:hypothetical protein